LIKDTCYGLDGSLSMEHVVRSTKKWNDVADYSLHYVAGHYTTAHCQTAASHVPHSTEWMLQAAKQIVSGR